MPTHSIVTTRAVAGLAALAIVAGACSSDAGSTADSTMTSPTTTTSPPTTSAPATTLAPTTTIAATTTIEATTTTLPATTTTAATTTTTEPPLTVDDLVLSSDGVLPFVFGTDDSEVIEGLTTVLSTPVGDRAQIYPNPDGDDFLDATEEEGYTQPIGRTVCFANDLCAQFGGATTDTLVFTGWDRAGETAPQLFTADGITTGSLWSDFPDSITVDEGGCFSTGFGQTAGIALTLRSVGDPFLYFDQDSAAGYVIGTPDPADVDVIIMSAGDLPFYLFDDC